MAALLEEKALGCISKIIFQNTQNWPTKEVLSLPQPWEGEKLEGHQWNC
jgi:hypothetical protein